MERHGFLEVETPQLTRPTPEGARDFLVPSRIRPRESYALPQSPQLFKQLLMVSGVERYYQIARCFRDEDLRADRQPEFTQLDVELSFGDEEDVYGLMEELFAELWRDCLDVDLPTPFPRMTYAEAMRRFGSDKPDLRYGLELVDLSEVLAGTGVGVFSGALEAGGSVIAIAVPAGEPLTRRELDGWVEWARARGAGGLAWGFVEDGEGGATTLRSPLSKFLTEAEIGAILRAADVPWREDASNATPVHLRNRMRRDVLPAWIEMVSDRDALAGAGLSRDRLEEDDEALEAWLDELAALTADDRLHLEVLRGRPTALWRRALHRWLARQPVETDLSRAGFEALLTALRGRPQGRFSLTGQAFAVWRRGYLDLLVKSA
jgi:hypothetical protein